MSQNNKPQTTPLSVRIETSDYEEMEKIAKEGERTLSQEVRRAIKVHIAKQKQLRSLSKQ